MLLFLAVMSPAAERTTVRATKIDQPISIDGKLDESLYRELIPVGLSVEIEPRENVEAPVKTEAYLAYDDRNLYVAFRAHDADPGGIRAYLTDRDQMFSGDFVGIVLDTFNDERRAYEFFVNPLGVQGDMTLNEVGLRTEFGESDEDPSWDAIWNSAGRLTPDGFEVEIAIPFSALRFPRTTGEQIWGVDLVRVYSRDRRHVLSLVPHDRNKSCRLCEIPKLTGLSGMSAGLDLEVAPTLTLHQTDLRGESDDLETDPGLNARWGITPNLTLNAAINPDFSQVEADSPQLDVNTQFTLFFREKRPFFLEGADFFSTPIDAVYTRTVSAPDWALKLTGKEGPNAIGVYIARDTVTNLIIPGSVESELTSLDQDNDAAVIRYRRDIGRASAIGVLFANRSGDGYSNRLLGVDGYFRFSDSDTIDVQMLRSTTDYPDPIALQFDQSSEAFDDEAISFTYQHQSREWEWRVTYDDAGPGFRADAGFVPQVDEREGELRLQRTWIGNESNWYTTLFLGTEYEKGETSSGSLLGENYQIHTGFTGPKQSFLFARVVFRERGFGGKHYDETYYGWFAEMRPSQNLYINLDGNAGDEIDYANNQAARLLRTIPSISYNAGKNIRVELTHAYETLDVSGGTLYEANFSELRAIYQFSLRTLVRLTLQRNHVARDPSLYRFEVERVSERVFPQILFSYKINPQTVFFAGYSETRLGNERIDLAREERTLFVKIGYAWLF